MFVWIIFADHEFMMYLFLLIVFQTSGDVLCMHIVPQSQTFQFQKVHLLLEAISEHSGKLSQVRFEEKIFIHVTIAYLLIKGYYFSGENSLTVNVLKFSTLLYQFSNKMLVFSTGLDKKKNFSVKLLKYFLTHLF